MALTRLEDGLRGTPSAISSAPDAIEEQLAEVTRALAELAQRRADAGVARPGAPRGGGRRELRRARSRLYDLAWRGCSERLRPEPPDRQAGFMQRRGLDPGRDRRAARR